MKRILILTACLLSVPCYSEVYLCDIDGVKTYTDKPCSVDEKPITVTVQNVAHTPTSKLQQQKQAVAKYVSNENTERRIDELKRKIKAVFKDRDRKLLSLKVSQRYSRNNLAGAVRDDGIASEMNAVIQKADSEVKIYQAEINNLIQLSRQ
ncbi:DUF4124 domain-containing protein [Parashewanella curva]|uniref:DUF4124 domain-containing protein n=1 Tax=Parashewanella curva TaxID=2338552 RepID=A0A3L8PZR8_9GAMM|nr:DUF4124 domain-containing protein [Parashewanella curva]RLV60956.1 DUF4124 domain-containing protein [Parashewanella curva]